jgi:outer membrane lipoprotein-sorting protein
MKNLPIVVLLLAAAGLGCGFMDRLTNSSTGSGPSNSTSTTFGSTQSGSDAAPPSGDPKADVVKASKKFLDLPQFTAKMNGQAAAGNMSMTLEYQAPDRFHMTGVDPTTRNQTEMIMIGKDMYIQGGGRWMKMPNAAGASMPNLRQYFDEKGLSTLQDVKYEGDETLDGRSMHVYSYHNTQTNANMPFPFNSKIWVGAADGLPHKIEVTYENGQLKSMTINYDFDKPVDIKAPI